MDTSPVTFLGEGIRPALLPVLAFARGAEGTGKLSRLPSHSSPLLCSMVAAGCSGGRPGAELCNRDSSHTLGDASLREYRQQEWAVYAASRRQCLLGSAFVHVGVVISHVPVCPVPVPTLLCTREICIPFPNTLPVTSVLSILS